MTDPHRTRRRYPVTVGIPPYDEEQYTGKLLDVLSQVSMLKKSSLLMALPRMIQPISSISTAALMKESNSCAFPLTRVREALW